MELIVILLSSISGALIGTSVGIYLLYRKLRPITGAELDLTRGKLRSTEYSLSSTTANLDNLRKQLEDRDQALAAAEERVRQFESAADAIRGQFADQENRAKDETKAVAETASRQLASYESQIDADERQIQELNGQVARLTAELAQLKNHFDHEMQSRTALDAQLTAEIENSRRFSSRVAELEAERSHFDLQLQEERQSAAKGMELLLMAQENLTRVFRPAHTEPAIESKTNGDAGSNGNSHALMAVAVAGDLRETE